MTPNSSSTIPVHALERLLQAMASPRALFFTAALFSLMLSVALFFTGDREQGIFVGIWVPSILSAGNMILGGGRNG